MKLTTLCYIEKDDKYLMIHRIKKKHDVNKDKWIGIDTMDHQVFVIFFNVA